MRIRLKGQNLNAGQGLMRVNYSAKAQTFYVHETGVDN